MSRGSLVYELSNVHHSGLLAPACGPQCCFQSCEPGGAAFPGEGISLVRRKGLRACLRHAREALRELWPRSRHILPSYPHVCYPLSFPNLHLCPQSD